MPGLFVDLTTTMTCPHGGKVTIAPAGAPVATLANQITVAACSLSAAGSSPCVKVQWANVANVLIDGKPALLQTPPPAIPMIGNGMCIGSAAPAPPFVLAVQLIVAGM